MIGLGIIPDKICDTVIYVPTFRGNFFFTQMPFAEIAGEIILLVEHPADGTMFEGISTGSAHIAVHAGFMRV